MKRHLVVGLLASVSALWACTEAPDPPEIVLGLVVSLSGPLNVSGPPTLEGARLAVDEINRDGGVDLGPSKRRLRLVVEDDASRPEISISKALKLIERDRAVALFGLPLSDNAIAVARVAEQHRVPLLSTLSTHPDTTRGRRWVFRVAFVDTFQARVLADFAYTDLEARRAAILFDAGNAYSRDFGKVFGEVFEARGGRLVATESFTPDALVVTEQLRRIHGSGAEVLVLPVYRPFLRTLIVQARDLGLETVFLGGDSFDVLSTAGKGGYYTDVWSPDLPDAGSRRFVEAYRGRHGHTPPTTAAVAYDAVYLIAAAATREGSAEPEAIRRGLADLGEFRGVTGTLRYRGTGDPERSAVLLRVDNDGVARFHREVEP